jgi:predicted AAA+ superfamily ATPase
MKNMSYLGAIILSGMGYLYIKNRSLKGDIQLRYRSDHPDFRKLLQYLYEMYPDHIHEINYEEERVYNFTEWRRKMKETPTTLKVITPYNCEFVAKHSYNGQIYLIKVSLSDILDKSGNILKKIEPSECSQEELLLRELVFRCECGDALIDYVDGSKKYIEDIYQRCRSKTKDTICIYYYKKDFWTLFSQAPKRSIDTIYLKETEGVKLLEQVRMFFSKDTRSTYLRYGIPYKNVSLIYGPPGTGKTSLIRAVASELDCDIFVLAITKDMLDTNLVEAFNYINDKQDNSRIIVMEDVDTLFDDRKEGDKNNGITMQGFLNCLDGFTCVEGTMLFMTANKPEVFDHAMIRSCRIDHKLKLDYADEYQTKNMYETFFPERTDFKSFYKKIRHHKYTTAMLQEFLFYNRDAENIQEKLVDFHEIVEKNNPKNYELLKQEGSHLYM